VVYSTTQTDIENKTRDLGGVHKYDLTPDATHLVVGSHDTQKYRHVARSRPDIKAMDAGWIETVTDLWRRDAHIDLPALEKGWQLRPLEAGGTPGSGLDGLKAKRKSLLVCLTGFDDRACLHTLIFTHRSQGRGRRALIFK
jgi:DNA replication regulator DPB11